MLSMTHDEASTYLNYIDTNVWQCFNNPKCWGTANLHWLNTLLMQPSVKLFGVSELSVRLPNLLLHVVYLVFSFLLVRDMQRPFLVTFAAFLMLNLSPYLVQFFSLARGYGMLCGWIMMSLYFLWKYIDTEKNKFVIGTFSGAFLAVMSNFVALNYLMALTGVFYLWLIYLLFFEKKADAHPAYKNELSESLPFGNKRVWAAFIPLPFLMTLAALLYRPLQFLSKGGEFLYGSNSLFHSLKTIVHDYLQSKAEIYFGKETILVFACLAIAFTVLATVRATHQFIRKKQDTRTAFLLAAVLILLGVIVIQKVQFHVMGTNYLVSRTALMLVPLGLLPMALCLLLWENRWVSGLLIIIGIFSVLHFKSLIDFTHCREWWYDIHTKDMALYVDNLEVEKPVKLGVHWTYHPATMFYWKTGELNAIDELLYNKEIRNDDYFDYYYVPLGDTAKLHPSYVVEKQFGYDWWLFRKE